MSARAEVVQFWDGEIAKWVNGDHTLSPILEQWKNSYQGRGQGAVDLSVFPEPYGGVLNGETPKLIMLGLNPGAAQPEFQGLHGSFTNQIRSSSYSEWAETVPYASAEWEAAKGVNTYLRNRVTFAKRLHADERVGADRLLFMELYPFHSSRVTASMHIPSAVLERFVFAPLGEIDSEFIFAFGKPWQRVAIMLGLGEGEVLRAAWQTPSREARLYPLRSGQTLIVMSQSGYAGPPGAEDTSKLRRSLNFR